MVEFKSQAETEEVEVKEYKLKPVKKMGKYKPYLEHTVRFPAKMRLEILEHLILTHTSEGEVILDMMAGTGSTGIVAAYHNRNAILVELEPHFYAWICEAIRKFQAQTALTTRGWIVAIKGDARNLASGSINRIIDIILTSPPYGRANTGGGIYKKGYEGKYGKDEKLHLRHDRKITKNPDNVSNLPFGKIDAVLTSPPYANIAKSKSGAIDPHMQGLISKLSGIPVKEFAHNKEKLKEATLIAQKKMPFKYSDNPNNVGNVPFKRGKRTYLTEMKKIYHEAFQVLRKGGKAIIVVRPFIRNRKVVDLPHITAQLLRSTGYFIRAINKYRIEPSFWRRNYEKKYPDVPKLRHEYAIIAEKPAKRETPI